MKAINQLPEEKAAEILDFAEFIIMQFEEQQLSKGIQCLIAGSNAFDFSNKDEDLYTEEDL